MIVGAGTAATDNPRLTVRRTNGRNPVRVVIDRHHRVPDSHHLFTDGAAPPYDWWPVAMTKTGIRLLNPLLAKSPVLEMRTPKPPSIRS